MRRPQKIPTDFTDYKSGKFPRKVSLRDKDGNIWPIGVTKTGRTFYFENGWKKFIEENNVELGDFFIFDYDGCGFDFILLGRNGCEKKGVGGLKLAQGMNDEHQKSVELKGINCTSDSGNSSSDDDSDEDYMEEEETEKKSHSKCKYVEEEEEDDDDDDEEEEEEEEENEKDDTFKKNTLGSKETSLCICT
ncbi:hypothetical protein KY290_031908 [Solanum tuberosum]|uniref:TF-B3 domain-containing protein n=1 Tax=Solanum tuberosum TaxID=4113 RepID=A0ABQ7UDZ3_SOLTU|nr:hypothetical protein KY289_031319 [Solanum tuberosum]KAH0743915.1 hypothetical protein KY290_031908 [Solanum tuberosum]